MKEKEKPWFGPTVDVVMAAIDEHAEEIESVPHYIGVGMGYRESKEGKTHTIAVLTDRELTEEERSALPDTIDGILVDYRNIGVVKAY